jgi:hypothetical protein
MVFELGMMKAGTMALLRSYYSPRESLPEIQRKRFEG